MFETQLMIINFPCYQRTYNWLVQTRHTHKDPPRQENVIRIDFWRSGRIKSPLAQTIEKSMIEDVKLQSSSMMSPRQLARVQVMGKTKRTIYLVLNLNLGKSVDLLTAILKSMASYLLHIFNWSSWASSTLRGLKNTSQLIKSNGKAFNPAPASQGILLQNFWLAAGSEFVTLVLRNLVFSLTTQYFFPCAAGQTRRLRRVKRRERISFRFKQAAFLKLKESAPTSSRVTLTSLVVTGFPLLPQEIQRPLLDGESRWLQVVLKQQRFFRYKCAQTSVVFKHITEGTWLDGTMSW